MDSAIQPLNNGDQDYTILAKKPSTTPNMHCKTKVNLGTDGSTVNNYKVKLGDDISHEFDKMKLRVSINRSIGLKIK